MTAATRPDPRGNVAHVAPDADPSLEHDLDGGHCQCRPTVLEVAATAGGDAVGFVVVHYGVTDPPLNRDALAPEVRELLR